MSNCHRTPNSRHYKRVCMYMDDLWSYLFSARLTSPFFNEGRVALLLYKSKERLPWEEDGLFSPERQAAASFLLSVKGGLPCSLKKKKKVSSLERGKEGPLSV